MIYCCKGQNLYSMKIEKNIEICHLYELYSDFLSNRQKDILYKHYFLDMSFSEIAENLTRQAVNDALKRAVMKLEEMEEKLHLGKIFNIVNDSKITNDEKIKELKKFV